MMRVIVSAAVRQVVEGRPEVAEAFERWRRLAAEAEWRSLTDVRKIFPTADGVVVASGGTATVLNLRGNHDRLVTTIAYVPGMVTAVQLLTHAEYDREKWKRTL